MIYLRETGEISNAGDFGGSYTGFLYTTLMGRMLLKVITSRFCSNVAARYYRSKFSVKRIREVEQAYGIDTSEYARGDFATFSDFFIRELKDQARPFSKKPTDFIALADSKLTCKTISDQLALDVKGGRYSLADITGNAEVAQNYRDGVCLIFRLTMDDYHRYIFPDNGCLLWTNVIEGKLHTIQPIAHQRYKPYISNYRVVSALATENFGTIMVIEVGALLAGRVNNHQRAQFQKGDEKGLFELGGSTILVLLEPETLRVDDDIIRYSDENVEVKVRRGETIGVREATRMQETIGVREAIRIQETSGMQNA